MAHVSPLLIRLWHRTAPSIPVYKTLDGVRIYMDLRDNIHNLVLLRGGLAGLEPRVHAVLEAIPGPVWDVGCNVGVFSVRASALGRAVTAFDLSAKAVAYLRRTAAYNRLAITVVDRPVTVRSTPFRRPETSHTENRLVPEADGADAPRSLTYLEAAAAHGVPDLLKMDIEGGEESFLGSEDFKTWIRDHRIAWLLEVHPQVPNQRLWADVPSLQVDRNHWLYCQDPDSLALATRHLDG